MWSGKQNVSEDGIPIALLLPKKKHHQQQQQQSTKKTKKKKKKLVDGEECICFMGGTPNYSPNDNTVDKLCLCAICQDPLFLIVQLYAPIYNVKRTLYVFGCNRSTCSNIPGKTIRCLRSQQTQTQTQPQQPKGNNKIASQIENDDYWGCEDEYLPKSIDCSSSTSTSVQPNAAAKDEEDRVSSLHADLEAILLKCEEEISNGRHSATAKASSSSTAININQQNCNTSNIHHPHQFPRLELEWMDEPQDNDTNSIRNNNIQELHNKDDDTILTKSKIEGMVQRYLQEEEDLELVSTLKKYGLLATTNGNKDDDSTCSDDSTLSQDLWLSFVNRIKRVPQQVVRYAYDGELMWPTPTNTESIPKCVCGSHRKFEFQLLPSLLHLLNVKKHVQKENNDGVNEKEEGMNWGTIAVYSCENSCEDSREEYVIVHNDTY